MTGRDERSAPTLFVIDDHPIVREGLRMFAESSAEVRVLGSSATASEALAPIAELQPDVIVLDLVLGDEDGLPWIPRLRSAAPGARVLVLTALRDRSLEEEALRAGASGLVLKDAPPEVLLRAIRCVVDGALWFDANVLARSRPAPPTAARAAGHAAGTGASLTPRERQLVALVAEGLRNEQVGRRLGISEKTVGNHLTAVFQKLGVAGRLELVVYAYEHGLAPRRG